MTPTARGSCVLRFTAQSCWRETTSFWPRATSHSPPIARIKRASSTGNQNSATQHGAHRLDSSWTEQDDCSHRRRLRDTPGTQANAEYRRVSRPRVCQRRRIPRCRGHVPRRMRRGRPRTRARCPASSWPAIRPWSRRNFRSSSSVAPPMKPRRASAIALGCIEYLRKPFMPIELLDAIFRATQEPPIP